MAAHVDKHEMPSLAVSPPDNDITEQCDHLESVNRMDEGAIWNCTDVDLENLGLIERGHIISVKGFCMPMGKNKDKEVLINSIRATGKERLEPSLKKRRNFSTKNVTFGWMHFDAVKNRYVSVRLSKGGGTRNTYFSNDSGMTDLLEFGKTLFFPNGCSIHGHLSDMVVHLGNYKGDIIMDEDFKLANYIYDNKLSKTRLYLLTKVKNKIQALLEELRSPIIPVTDDSDNSDHEEKTVIDIDKTTSERTRRETSRPIRFRHSIGSPNLSSLTSSLSTTEDKEQSSSGGLIGSTEDRERLRQEINDAYQQSLEIDQRKENQKEQEEIKNQRQADLKERRLSFVLPEPGVDEDHVVISVRHPHIGNKVRLFRTGSKMLDVYNWVGSLHEIPEHFQLIDYSANNIVEPDQEVCSLALNMNEVTNPFISAVQKPNGEKETEERVEITQGECMTHLQKVENCRKIALDKLILQGRHITVSFDNVFGDLISHYRKIDILSERINLSFSEDFGVGDGATKDVYAKCFDEFYKQCEGERQKVPIATMDENDLETFGKLITHAFIQHGLFPLQISKASIEYSLYGNVDDKDLVSTFLLFLPENERALFEKFSEVQPVLDILTEYKIFDSPNASNILDLCKKAANVALIRLPCFGVNSIVKGMGKFWSGFSREMFHSIYSCIVPNPERVINSLLVNELQQTEAKIVTWLHRFIRNCTPAQLFSFVRFVTGSPNLWPDDIIKVEFVDQAKQYIRPTTQTCFKILHLPRQYVSYTELSSNIIDNMAFEENWIISDKL
ncbi:uncharacterized protein LOC130649582 isoform X2 [Hydractinia symbiolongicarpus]|uniref:uncharacterized protein LOC130649582 isoform X2 n=1 Tax=Hydractinia symbiolongicarpus TaxID=13093 RepID=UPI00254C71B8|nr:uncharacterized protein LOC130649582 isoform X2 [Hydractinia symbiolongicarpus]